MDLRFVVNTTINGDKIQAEQLRVLHISVSGLKSAASARLLCSLSADGYFRYAYIALYGYPLKLESDSEQYSEVAAGTPWQRDSMDVGGNVNIVGNVTVNGTPIGG